MQFIPFQGVIKTDPSGGRLFIYKFVVAPDVNRSSMPKTPVIRNIFKHTAIYAFGLILQKAIGFLMLPVYANYLGAEGYGIVGMIDVVVSIMTVSVGYGIGAGMRRFYFERETDTEKKTLVSTCIIVMFLLVMAVSLPTLLFSGPISRFMLGSVEMGGYYVAIAILTFICDMTSTSAGGYIMIKEQSKLYSTLSFSRFFFGLLFNIYFIVVLERGILGLLLSNLITSFIYSVVVHYYTLKQVGIRYEKRDAKEIIRYSLPLLPGSFAMLVRNDVDKFILRMFMGLSQIGTYCMLTNFSSIITNLVVQPFLNIWNVKAFEICETEDGPQVMANVFTLQLSIMLFVGLILSVEIPLILKVTAPKEFWVPSLYAFLAVFSRILFSAYYSLNFGLAYAKLTHKISNIQIATALLSVVLNYLTIRHFGLVGALASSCAVFLAQCIMAYYMSDKLYHIPFEWRKISWLLLIFMLLFFGIDSFTLSYLGLPSDGIIYKTIATDFFSAMHLSFFLKSKIFVHIIMSLNLVMDALAKLLLCLLFIVAAVLLGVIKKENIMDPVYAIFEKFGLRFSK